MPALLGGLFIGVLSALPIISCCCCLWMFGGGVLAAYLKSQSRPTSLSMSEGATVGLLAGVVGAFVMLLVSTALSPINSRFLELARNAAEMPPEVQQMIEAMESGGIGGDAFNVAGAVVSFVLTLCVVSVLSTIGGMVGAAYFKRDVPPALGGPINPPPIPGN
jgi:hypothetical protein